jgi:hypothetical protein
MRGVMVSTSMSRTTKSMGTKKFIFLPEYSRQFPWITNRLVC